MVVMVVMISMMVMNKMTLSLAQDEEELTATMIRFVEDPEDRTKQARKVIIITITIFTINTTIDAKQEPKVRVPLQLLRLLRSPAPMQEKRNTLDR